MKGVILAAVWYLTDINAWLAHLDKVIDEHWEYLVTFYDTTDRYEIVYNIIQEQEMRCRILAERN